MPRTTAAIVLALLPTVGVRGDEPLVLRDLGGWVGAVAFAPDGRTLAVGTSDGRVAVFDAASGRRVSTVRAHDDAVAALAYSPDGKALVSGGHDRVAVLHRGDQRHALRGHAGAVLAVAVAPDGRRLFTGGIDSTIRVWDAATRTVVQTLGDHTSWVNGLAVNGPLLASAGSDNVLRLWPAPDFAPRHTFRVKDGELRAAAISPDRTRVAAGVRYGGVRVWDVESRREIAALKGHAGETWAVAFTPDGKTLASGGGDWNRPGEVRLWDTAAWAERAVLRHSGEVLCLAITADGRRLAAGSWDRTVRVWSLGR